MRFLVTKMDRRAQKAAWYAKNREAVLARMAEYYTANREARLAYMAEYSAGNKEAKRAYDAAYHVENREVRRVQQAAHTAANKESKAAYDAEYRTANPERRAALNAVRRARKLAVGGDLTPSMETELRKYSTHCAMCSEEFVRTEGQYHPRYPHLDHIIPLGVGGPHSLANVRMVCHDCNLGRPKDGSDVPDEIRHEILGY